MKHSRLLGVLACASVLFASASALAAPGDTAPKKKKKPKSSVVATTPKTDDGTSTTTVTATATPAPETKATTAPAAPAAAPAPVAPETKAADSKVPEATPQRDHAAESKKGDDADTDKPISIAPLLGFGSNHFGFGAGVRGGYTLPSKVYLGGQFMYNFGSSYAYGLYGDYSTHVLYPSAEVGYDFHAGPVTIRPYGGVGVAFISSSVPLPDGSSASASTSSLLLYPGAAVVWNVPKSSFFVGGDVRMLILTRGGDPSFNLFATGGMKF